MTEAGDWEVGGVVLVVDSDESRRGSVRRTLEDASYSVLEASELSETIRILNQRHPDLVLLSTSSEVFPLNIVQQMRSETPDLGLIVAAPDTTGEALYHALSAGADDFMRMPFRLHELRARVGALLRRARLRRNTETFEIQSRLGEIRLEAALQVVTVHGERVPLTLAETQLLSALMTAPDQGLTTDELLARAWGPGYRGHRGILRTNIYRLRQKLERDPRHPEFILSRYGVGYTFASAHSQRLSTS